MTASAGVVATLALLAGIPGQGQSVRVASADGFRLHASYSGPPTQGPGLLLLHACNRSGAATGYERLAPLLAERGFHVLVLDSRGFGDSRDERYRSYRQQADEIDALVPADVEAALKFLAAHPEVDDGRLGIVAASCGTWQAIPLAAAHPEVGALVFVSGSYLDLERVTETYEQLRDRPLLTVHAEQDRYRAPESMDHAFARNRHPASRQIVTKGNAHATALFDVFEDLEGEIVAWLAARLLAAE